MDNTESIKDKTIKDMIWSFLDTVGSRVIQLIMQLFLARLLLPYDYGVFGIATIFIMLSNVLIESGFKSALIREKNTSQEDYSTVFFYNLFVAVTLYILLFINAGHISLFFELPELVSVLRLYGLVMIIDAVGLVQKIILTKELKFKFQMKINLSSSVLSGIIAIGFALAGYGLWSIVIKMSLFHLFQTASYCFVNKWKPSFTFSKTSFKRLFNFGWKLLVSGFVAVLYENLYILIIGRGFSTANLGLYTNARKINDAASVSMALSIEKVSYPVLSKFQDDDGRLKEGFQRILKSSVFISFPVMFGLAAIAPALFRILLGDNWVPAIPYFQILSFSGIFISLHNINLNILKVKGRSDLFLKVNIFEKIVGFFIVGCILLLRLGINGLLWGLVLNHFITYFIFASHSKKLIRYSIIEQLKDISIILLIAGIMAAVTFSLNFFITNNDWLLLFSQMSISLFLYFFLSHLFRVKELEIVYQILAPIHKVLIKKTI